MLSNKHGLDGSAGSHTDEEDDDGGGGNVASTNTTTTTRHSTMHQPHSVLKTSNGKSSNFDMPPPCSCPYFGDAPHGATIAKPAEVKIVATSRSFLSTKSNSLPEKITHSTSISDGPSLSITPACTKSSLSSPSKTSLQIIPASTSIRKLSYSKTNSVVTWDTKRNQRRGSSFGGVRTSLMLTPTKTQQITVSPLRRSATLRNHNNIMNCDNSNTLSIRTIKAPSTPCLLQRSATIRSHHSRNSSVISRNSSRHGRIIRLEQKATKVLGVVFFTFVILWAPFFILNLLPSVCQTCEDNMAHWVIDLVTWLGYGSSMVNPIFYTIFNKVFRQAFKKVLMCQYRKSKWRPPS